jgi:signal transduction histidine kinase
MPLPRLRQDSPPWLRWPRRTARFRLTALYSGLFLVSGTALIAMTYALFERATAFRAPQLPDVPHPAAIQDLRLPESVARALPQLYGTLGPLKGLQHQLLQLPIPAVARSGDPLRTYAAELGRDRQTLVRDQHRLLQDQHRIADAVAHLAQAVHHVAQTGTLEAAQRASDSHQLLVNSGIALAAAAVLALLAGWLISGRTLRPIRLITHTARRISSTSLHERLGLDGPQDELKELGDTLDDLFGRLEAAFAAQRHFVANAAHELRTPLTAERSLLQVALDDPSTSTQAWRSTAEEVLASNVEQARLIESLLTLASSESGLANPELVDLAAIVTAVLDDLQSDAERLHLLIEASTPPAQFEGDPMLVERLVANLLRNAVYHNTEGGRVVVVTEEHHGEAVLRVSNTGEAVPPADVDRLFEPFQRLDPRRAHHKSGHGLGLSIVRAVAASHGASIVANPLPDGGLFVSVAFPPAPGVAVHAGHYSTTGRAGSSHVQSTCRV